MIAADKWLFAAGIAVLAFSLGLFLFSWLRDRSKRRKQERDFDDLWRAVEREKSDSDQEPFEIKG